MTGPHDRVARLAEQLAPELLRYFVRRVASPDDAADLVGETFVVLARRTASVPKPDEEARMWIYGVARNILLDHRKRGVRRQALAERLREELRIQSSESDPFTDQLHEALAHLDDVDQEIIRLIHWGASPKRRSPTTST